jgi:hypothetical protein
MGLAYEWGAAQTIMGSSATGVNTAYRQLLQNLMAYGSGPLILRIGGSSTDKTGEPTATTAIPFAELATDLNVHFYLGVNLGANNVNLAVNQAKAYISQMPAESLDAIEIGNEPDGYASNGMRSPTYSFQDYLKDFETWKSKISPILPSYTRLMGTSWCCTKSLTNIQSYASVEHSSLDNFSQHYYVANGIAENSDDILLKSSSATKGPKAVAAAVAIAHNFKIPFRMGELNSLYNGGMNGVSDSFQSALWAIDTMFEYASVGVDGVNWQTGQSATDAYNPISVTTSTASGISSYIISVRPLYYGLLLFQEATGSNAHFLPVTLSTNANLKAWATIDAFGNPRIVIINKEKNTSGTVLVTPPAKFTHAQITILKAQSYLATTGVTLAGQTFDESQDGTIQGKRSTITVEIVNGAFQIPIPITSAALITFSN